MSRMYARTLGTETTFVAPSWICPDVWMLQSLEVTVVTQRDSAQSLCNLCRTNPTLIPACHAYFPGNAANFWMLASVSMGSHAPWKMEFGLISVRQSGIDKVRHYVENNKWRAENVLIELVTSSLWFCKQQRIQDQLWYIQIPYCIELLCETYPGVLPQTWKPDYSPLQTKSLRWKCSENLSPRHWNRSKVLLKKHK